MDDRQNIIRFYHFLNLALLALIARSFFRLYSILPERFPTKFDFSGRPYHWSGKGSLIVFLIMAIALTMMMYIFIWRMPKMVNIKAKVNIPDKEEFFKLPVEKRLIYFRFVSEFLAALTVSMNIMWLTMLEGIGAVALEKSNGMPIWAIWPGLALMGICMLYYIINMIKMPKRLIKEHNEPGATIFR